MSTDTIVLLFVGGFILYISFLIFWNNREHKKTSLKRANPPPDNKEIVFGKNFKFIICDNESEADDNQWFHLERWKSPNFVKMNTSWPDDWQAFPPEVTVMGINKDPQRGIDFLTLADRPDFRIFLQREPSNPYDPNAIKVMASATVDGDQRFRHIGYIPKELAEMLKDEKELDARPHCAYLPYQGSDLNLKIRVLVRE